jgi:hypothetical protein
MRIQTLGGSEAKQGPGYRVRGICEWKDAGDPPEEVRQMLLTKLQAAMDLVNGVEPAATEPAKETPKKVKKRSKSQILQGIKTALETAHSEMESLKDDLEEWVTGNESTGLSGSQRFTDWSEAVGTLEEQAGELDNISTELENVTL